MLYPYQWQQEFFSRYQYAKDRFIAQTGDDAWWWLKQQHDTLSQAMANSVVLAAPVLLVASNPHHIKASSLRPLEMVGGAFYLTELTSKVASAANIEYHARVIAQKYLMREMIKIGDKTVQMAYDETTDVFDLLDETEKSLFELSETNLRRNYMPMSDLVHSTLKRLEGLQGQEGGITGVPSGFRMMDAMTSGFQPSDLVIVAARPAMGKTAFTLTACRNAAVAFGVPVAFFSLEMAATQLVQRLLCAEAEIDAQKVRTGRLEAYEWTQLTEKIGGLSKAPIYIDDTPGLSPILTSWRARLFSLKAACKASNSSIGTWW